MRNQVVITGVEATFDGQLVVKGWSLVEGGTATISIYIGNRKIGETYANLPIRDLDTDSPEYLSASSCGFLLTGSYVGLPAGSAHLQAVATSPLGRHVQTKFAITIPSLALEAETPKVGTLQEKAQASDAWIKANCDLATVSADGDVVLKGWAFSSSRIVSVSLFDGEAEIGKATIRLPRPDVGQLHKDERNASNSGFYLQCKTYDPNRLLGKSLTLRVRTAAGSLAVADISLREAGTHVKLSSGRPVLEIDKPADIKRGGIVRVRGALEIAGWAVAPGGISRIEIYCDSEKIGRTNLGGRREDVGAYFPDYRNSLRSGYDIIFPPRAIPDGRHTIRLVAHSVTGDGVERSFEVEVCTDDAAFPASSLRRYVPSAEIRFAETLFASRRKSPVVGIVVQVHGHPADEILTALRNTLVSIERQAYRSFQVVLAAPGPLAKVKCGEVLTEFSDQLRSKTSISTKANKLANAGRHKFDRSSVFMVLECGDVLGADALLEFAASTVIWPDADIIYSDDIRFDISSGRKSPFFKPDWSPELFLNLDYFGTAWCVPGSLLARLGMSSTDLLWRSPYDIALELSEGAQLVRHINRLLIEASLPYPRQAPKILSGAIIRRRIKARVVKAGAHMLRFQRAISLKAHVSIVIPTAGKDGLIRKAIRSIKETTLGLKIQIIVLDNVPAEDRRLKQWLRKVADKVVDVAAPFNWSRFNNLGAAVADGNYLLFLNDDIEALHAGWLQALLEHAQRSEVGVVGARLIYPDQRIQHGGQYLSGTGARHSFRFLEKSDLGSFGMAQVTREVASITGACMLVRTKAFQKLGGFNESHDVINNDLDFCLRVRVQGLSVIFTPYAELIHHELASRATMPDSFDEMRFDADWRVLLTQGDPFHSRRLMLTSDLYAIDSEPVVAIYAGPQGPPVHQITRILAVKLDHIGDFVLAFPAIKALKKGFPNAKVTVLVSPASAVLAQAQPFIDDIIVFQFFHARSVDGRRDLESEAFEKLRLTLASTAFDLAIDLRVHTETRQVLKLVEGAYLVGYDHAGAFPWLDMSLEWEGDLQITRKHTHISDRMTALVTAAVASCSANDVAIVDPVESSFNVPLLARLPPQFRLGPLICVHPGVGNSSRQWPAASFAALIDLLIEEMGASVILIGVGEEEAIADDVISRVVKRGRVVSLAGKTPLNQLSLALSACNMFIGNNSGPHHIAASLGVPTLGIHSGVVDASEWAPLGKAAVALRRSVVCSPCYLEQASDCPRAMACLTGIQPREVLAMCRRLLAMRPEAVVPQQLSRGGRRRQLVRTATAITARPTQ